MPSPIRVLIGALVLFALGTSGRAQGENVLILLADDVGIDVVGCYGVGAAPPPTPNIDALAYNGVLFRDAWAYPFCSATRACIQTGRWGFRTGVGRPISAGQWDPESVLDLSETTIPELLDQTRSGYAHAAIGKWHLGNHSNGGALGPNLAGYSHFAGAIEGVFPYFSWPRTVDGVTATTTVYSTTQMVDDALSWIARTPEPWVCYVAFNAANSPFHIPPSHLHGYNLNGITPAQDPVSYYKAIVQAMDSEIGRLLSSMPQGVRDRTNVLFLGDNGTPPIATEPPFDPTHAKGTPYEGSVHVPFLFAGPAVVEPGREVDAMVSAVDVFATVAELCGVDPSVPYTAVDSVSLVPHLESAATQELRTAMLAEMFRFKQFQTGFVTIRDPRFKLIRYLDFTPPVDELYDLATDPFEQDDLLLAPTLAPAAANAYANLQSTLVILRDQNGTLRPFGSGSCQGSQGTPSISGSGTPRLGSAYAISLSSAPPSTPAFLAIGSSTTRWSGMPLPFDLGTIGAGAGCFLQNAVEQVIPVITSATGSATLSVPLPNLNTLVGGSIHHSWLLVDAMAPSNPLGIVSTTGLTAIVGNAAGM